MSKFIGRLITSIKIRDIQEPEDIDKCDAPGTVVDKEVK